MEVNDETINGSSYMAVINPLWYSVSIYDGQEKYEKDLAQFSKEQRLVFACAWYLSEINNGGHEQFYSNSTGIVWKDALSGFDSLGLKEFAEVLAESARRLGGSPDMNRTERLNQLERLQPKFNDLDNRIYAMEEDSDVDQAFMAFIRANRSKFYFSGEILA